MTASALRTTALRLAVEMAHHEPSHSIIARAGDYLAFLDGRLPEAANDLPADTAQPAPKPMDDDGWINWAGGACPVHPQTKVLVRYRGGSCTRVASPAIEFSWSHPWAPLAGLRGGSADIVAYKVIEVFVPAAATTRLDVHEGGTLTTFVPTPMPPLGSIKPCAFKPGDRVRCISTPEAKPSFFKIGETYTVAGISLDVADPRYDFVSVKLGAGMFAWRFELANDVLQPGDRVKHGGEVYEIVAPPRVWTHRGVRYDEVAAWSDRTGFIGLFVSTVERVA